MSRDVPMKKAMAIGDGLNLALKSILTISLLVRGTILQGFVKLQKFRQFVAHALPRMDSMSVKSS